jgi:hypothetical protein
VAVVVVIVVVVVVEVVFVALESAIVAPAVVAGSPQPTRICC